MIKQLVKYTNMLMRSFAFRPMTTLISYSFELKKSTVQKNFDKNFKYAREQISKVAGQFSMSKNQSKRIFHYFPNVFKPQSKQFETFKAAVERVRQLAKKGGKRGAIGRVFERVIFDNNHLAFDMKQQKLQAVVQAVEKQFLDQNQIQKIFTSCPNLINDKFPDILNEKLDILTSHLSITREQAMEIFQVSPFLLPTSSKKLRQSIITMFNAFSFTKQQIVQHMKTMGEVYLLGGLTLRDVARTPIRWGLTTQQMKQTFIKNPLLFFNYPYDVMPRKRKILKYLTLTIQTARKIFLEHPQIIIWSVRSLQEKALFLKNRLNIEVDNQTIQLLIFNYNKTLRPRGEILIRSKTVYTNENIVKFMRMSNEQFAQKTGVSLQRLNEQIKKFPITIEMDFKKTNVLTKIGAKQKFLKLASVYEH